MLIRAASRNIDTKTPRNEKIDELNEKAK
jgi:hypothetical protein